VPGSEAELVGILAPGVGLTALRDDGAEVRIRQDIHPRGRCHLLLRGRDDVFAPVRSESSQPVEEYQILARRRDGWRGRGAAGSGWRQARHGDFRRAATGELVRQQSPAVGDDRAGDRLEQNAVLVRYLVNRSDERCRPADPSRWLRPLRQSAP
jgi:hypothetical protein